MSNSGTSDGPLGKDQSQWMALFDANPTGLVLIDAETRVIRQVNAAAARMIGLPAEQIVGKICHGFLCPSEAKRCPVCDLGQEVDRSERILIKASGEQIPILKTVVPITLNHQTYLLESFIDITERKNSEQALIDSEAKYRILFETASDGILIADVATREFLYSNPALCRMLGYSEKELKTMRVEDLHPKKDLPDIIAKFEAQYRGDITLAPDIPCRRKDGSVFPVDISTTGILLQGRPCNVGYFRNITERKQAEEALQKSKEMLLEAQSVAGLGSYVLHIQTGIWNASEVMKKIFGLTQTTDHNLSEWEKLLHPDDRKRIMDYFLDEVVGQGHSFNKEYRILRKNDQSERWVHGLGKLEFDKEGQPLKMIGTIQDITERKQAKEQQAHLEAELQQAQKMESVGRLAGGVAHDFNNMLGVILGRVEMAIEQIDPSQPLHEDLMEIQKAAERSADFTRQLLAFARKQTIAPLPLNLNETIDNISQMLKRLIGENISLHWEPQTDLWPVRADPSQLDQLLTNLCVNARDAIDEIGDITIQTQNVLLTKSDCAGREGCRPGEFVMLSVRDTGRGMDEETQQHIFEPFFTTKSIGEGTGLGLATAYGAVRQNNGFIDVSSQPGQGATFRIYLPRYTGKPAESTPLAASPLMTPPGHETILVVEDELAILQMTTKMLEREGYTVLSAGMPGKAMHHAREHAGPIHLLITDVVMPEMNGRDLAKKIIALYPQLKRLFMSGYTADVIAHNGVLDEGVYFIQKPFSQKELAARVRKALDAPQA